ncbi:MAG: hypothetical protein AAF656_00075 [Planctomycetota bacterium]
MKRVYLDQNKWIDLSRAYHGRDGGGGFADVLQLCFARREQGAASFPFSAQHYMELTKRGNQASRERLATFSNGDTMASYTALVPELVARYCQRLGGLQEAEPPEVFGRGLDFAFGKQVFPPHIREANPEWAAKVAHDLAMPGVLADRLSNPEGDDRAQVASVMRLHGEKVAEAAENMRRHEPPLPTELFEDTLHYRIAFSTGDEVSKACERLGADAEFFLGDVGAMRAGVAAIPPLRTELALIRDQVTQAQRKVQPNDMVDIAAMAVVIPYCDVVVSERHWTHVCHHAGLAKQFGTTVLTNVNDLKDHL